MADRVGTTNFLAGLVMVVFLSCYSLSSFATVAEIVSIAGKGEFKERVDTQWRAAYIKQAISVESFVRTGDLSAMAVLFGDRTQIRLAQNSMLQIKRPDREGADNVIRLDLGRAWTQAKRAPPQSSKPAKRLVMETPSAIAGIRGTDWEMEVDAQGRARLTVLHGEVEFFNELGSVVVRDKEQALAEKGKAPVKLQLFNPAERVQWVTSYRVDLARYPELETLDKLDLSQEVSELRRVVDSLRRQHMQEAHQRLSRLAEMSDLQFAATFLLLADFSIYLGDLQRAADVLRQGNRRFPADPRFDAQLARVALYRDDMAAAREWLAIGLARHPDSAEVHLARGEVARVEGEAMQAEHAYRQAVRLAADDSRGWHGLGVVESEREDIKPGRRFLLKALELDGQSAATLGELGTLETFANNFDRANHYYERALTLLPDNYVGLTGLGLLQLKAGETEQALDSLLRANLMEPNYARATVYLAVAYYQLGQHETALQMLSRAAELDRLDPLPHLLASMIHTDLVDPGRAVGEAREAMRLMPYLKSLNQVANDQKGAANLGNALAQFGLEDWALNYAQQSYNPFWAGSHLFLADRYLGKFNKNSELMQGYLTDPVVFGASNRFQTLLPKPGAYLSVGMLASQNDDLRATTPNFIANGYVVDRVPLAWFVEGRRTRLAETLAGEGNIMTAAVGSALREDVGIFAFASRFDAEVRGASTPLSSNRVGGQENRLDMGFNYKLSPVSQSWFKLGFGEETARHDTTDLRGAMTASSSFAFEPRNEDVQYRHSLRLGEAEWSWGLEYARIDKRFSLASETSSSALRTTSREEGDETDDSVLAYLVDRHRLTDALLLDIGLHAGRYTKNTDSVTRVNQNGAAYVDSRGEDYARTGIYPRLGLSYQAMPGEVWRLAYQRWLRPNVASTLSPVATAGVPLDDQIVLPGGEMARWRLQWEREFSNRGFVSLFLDAKRVHNLGQPGNVLNQRQEVADLDRLRNRAALQFQTYGETLEQPPTFLKGNIVSAGMGINRLLTATLSASLNYVYREAENTHPWFDGFDLPYLPRRQLTLGMSWAGPKRLLVQAQAIYRSRRYTDENNSAELMAGWDAALKANWQSADKRWLLEAYAMNLLSKNEPTALGINAVWRY